MGRCAAEYLALSGARGKGPAVSHRGDGEAGGEDEEGSGGEHKKHGDSPQRDSKRCQLVGLAPLPHVRVIGLPAQTRGWREPECQQAQPHVDPHCDTLCFQD